MRVVLGRFGVCHDEQVQLTPLVMSLALNKPKLDNLASDIWKSAERLRGCWPAWRRNPPNGFGTVSFAAGSSTHCPSTTRRYS